MTNNYPGIYSISSNQYVHVNHGWWCSECTNHLFEVDRKTDHTAEWIEVLRQWSRIAIIMAWEGFLVFANATMNFVIGTIWIAICFFEGVESDTRAYEKQLHEKDGLDRSTRDDLNKSYHLLQKERHYLVVAIDQCKSSLGKEHFVSKEKTYQKPEQDFIERSAVSRPPAPNTDEEASRLSTYTNRLVEVEAQLANYENRLRIHQGV